MNSSNVINNNVADPKVIQQTNVVDPKVVQNSNVEDPKVVHKSKVDDPKGVTICNVRDPKEVPNSNASDLNWVSDPMVVDEDDVPISSDDCDEVNSFDASDLIVVSQPDASLPNSDIGLFSSPSSPPSASDPPEDDISDFTDATSSSGSWESPDFNSSS